MAKKVIPRLHFSDFSFCFSKSLSSCIFSFFNSSKSLLKPFVSFNNPEKLSDSFLFSESLLFVILEIKLFVDSFIRLFLFILLSLLLLFEIIFLLMLILILLLILLLAVLLLGLWMMLLCISFLAYILLSY